MSYFDSEKNVAHYIEMMRGECNKFILNEVHENLTTGKKMLELGIGAGIDLDILKKDYDVIGSDLSQLFLDNYRKKDRKIKLKKLDAVKLDINDKFDYIYSNKVLSHLSDDELEESFFNQSKILVDGGQIFHTFWKGTTSKTFDGLYFNYQVKENIINLCERWFYVKKYVEYTEMEENDSFYVILKKKWRNINYDTEIDF